MPLPELEKQFAAFARERAEKLAPGVDIDKPPTALANSQDAPTNSVPFVLNGPNKTSSRAAWEAAHPDNYYVRRDKVLALMRDKKWAEAKPILEALVQAYHGEKQADNPLWMLAATERHLRDTNAELATLKTFAAQESDFADLFNRLIALCTQQKDWVSVTNYTERLLAINPLSPVPHRALAEAGVALGNPEQSIVGYRKLLLLDPPDPAETHFQLGKLLHARGNSDAEAKRQVLQALEEAPRFREAQRLLLDLEKNSPQPQANAAASIKAGP
jgi:tetratricopeptide (TPR) repeat protein